MSEYIVLCFYINVARCAYVSILLFTILVYFRDNLSLSRISVIAPLCVCILHLVRIDYLLLMDI